MKKIFCGLICTLLTSFVFADGICKDHGQRYNDSFCNSSNDNKEKTCRDGYSDGYGDQKEWCPKCKAYYPTGTHNCTKK